MTAYETSEYGERIMRAETEIHSIKEDICADRRNLKDTLNEIFARLNKLELTDAKIIGVIIATSTITSIIAAAAVVVIQIYISRGSP
jgi:hypothetical protein